MDGIYFITTVENLQLKGVFTDGVGSRTVGYFLTLEEAKLRVETNKLDIHENIYDYAVIEKLTDGLYPDTLEIYFYKWDKENKKYVEVNRPSEWEEICNFSIG